MIPDVESKASPHESTLSIKRVPQQHSQPHEIIYQGAAIECATLEVFLRVIGDIADEVLLMPLRRSAPNGGGGNLTHTFAVHLTCRTSGEDKPVCYATFIASQLSGVGESWRLTYPFEKKRRTTVDVGVKLGQQLVEELQSAICDALARSLSPETTILCPARYRLPDEYIWGVRNSSERVGFMEGHWLFQ